MAGHLRRALQGVGLAMALGMAAAGGWLAGRTPRQTCSLMNPPTYMSAHSEAAREEPEVRSGEGREGNDAEPFGGRGEGAEAPQEAETAANTVQSASEPAAESEGFQTGGEPGGAAGAGMADGPNDELLEMETQEARSVVAHLTRENETLRREGAELRRKVELLAEALASAQAALDAEATRAESPRGETSPDPAGEALILDVNPGLGMVVLDAGRKQGMRRGLVLTVLRGRQYAGRVRIEDVRESVSGAVVEDTPSGDAPKTGDRVVLTGGPKDSQGK